MFRIECFVDDKDLAKMLWALKELRAYNLKSEPVNSNVGEAKPNGAAKKHAGPLSIVKSTAEIPMLFVAWCKKHKRQEVKASDVKEFALSLGYSKGSYSYLLMQLRDKFGVLSTTGKRKKYGGLISPIYRVHSDKKTLAKLATAAKRTQAEAS